VWPFPTFRFTYYYSQEDIMGGGPSKPAVSKEETEVLTMHPSWESHVNEEKNSGFFFSLINKHIPCVLGTILFALCIMICILLGYLGYRRFCQRRRPKRQQRRRPHQLALHVLFSSVIDLFAPLGQGGNGGQIQRVNASTR
jgi:hypothetical protein